MRLDEFCAYSYKNSDGEVTTCLPKANSKPIVNEGVVRPRLAYDAHGRQRRDIIVNVFISGNIR